MRGALSDARLAQGYQQDLGTPDYHKLTEIYVIASSFNILNLYNTIKIESIYKSRDDRRKCL